MNIGIIGLGLIGGSFGLAVVSKTQHRVYGHDISDAVISEAQNVGAIHAPLTDDIYRELDLIIVALTTRQFADTLPQLCARLKKGALVIDICGLMKKPIEAMKIAAGQYPGIKFISTHPMAGKEVCGISNASVALFENSSIIVSSVKANQEDIVNLNQLLKDIGFSRIEYADADKHDAIIAYTSQLPHIISSAFIQSDTALAHHGFSAGSFLDLSRVSKMNYNMWSELVVDNAEQVLPELDAFIERLNSFKQAINKGDEARVRDMFKAGDAQKRKSEKK
jgi:prephenate dehydrogenase